MPPSASIKRPLPAVVAIDGPAASGKGTIARRIAAILGYAHLDTGKLYRAVGWAMLQGGRDLADAEAAAAFATNLDLALLDDPQLTSDEAGKAASIVAAHPPVRAALLQLQRDFAATPPAGAGGAVLDGRDIGTVVCPAAESKLYVTASVEVRARRRHNELIGGGRKASFEDVLQDLIDRDRRDAGRSVAPMRPADDARTLDTSDLDADQAVAQALAIVTGQDA